MPPRIRAAALSSYAEAARSVGLDPYAMLARVGLNESVLECPELPVDVAPVAELLEQSAADSGCQTFGLRMAETRSLSTLGLVGLLLEHQPTARAVIGALVHYQSLLAEALAISLVDKDDLLIVRVDLLSGGRQSVDLVMGFACRVIATAMHGRWQPDSAHFAYGAPEDLSVHERVFACPLVFDDLFNGFASRPDMLDVANPGADAHMAQHAAELLDRVVAEA